MVSKPPTPGKRPQRSVKKAKTSWRCEDGVVVEVRDLGGARWWVMVMVMVVVLVVVVVVCLWKDGIRRTDDEYAIYD